MPAASLPLSRIEREAARRIALYGLADLLELMRLPPALRTSPPSAGQAEELLEVLAAVDGAPGTPWARVDRRGVSPRALAALESVACEARDAACFAARHEDSAVGGSRARHDLSLRDDARIVRGICARLATHSR